MDMVRKLELLAPARNLECGRAAIACGADAVYIGAERFGARQAAGNSLADIKELTDYAHKFLARVYVTVNTIIYDGEISATEQLIHNLYNIGVDAILIQDMSITRMDVPPITLHASTQTDNRTSAKVRWLSDMGMSRVVLARELSLNEIKAIHKDCPDVELEAFVHGALCVSYSGQCYASCFLTSRSANRGECSQICRLPYTLIDGRGKELSSKRYYLSLKDMCRINQLSDLAEAGVSSFKIEGRLKEADYVKNVAAAYSKALDDVVAKSGGKYARASIGHAHITFVPNIEKSFNRGFTPYYLNGRIDSVSSMLTPKYVGSYIGKVKNVGRGWFTVASKEKFANGDGLCFFLENGGGDVNLIGFRVNFVDGTKLYPFVMPKDLREGCELYRNHDVAFLTELERSQACRTIGLDLILRRTDDGAELTATVAVDKTITVRANINVEMQIAKTQQTDNIVRTLSKLGGTVYSVSSLTIEQGMEQLFIPNSRLTELRRLAVEMIDSKIADRLKETTERRRRQADKVRFEDDENNPTPWSNNIANHLAQQLYQQVGSKRIEPAFELRPDKQNAQRGSLMQCRYCIRRELKRCKKRDTEETPWIEPLGLRLDDGRTLWLEFDCKHCQMNVWSNRESINN